MDSEPAPKRPRGSRWLMLTSAALMVAGAVTLIHSATETTGPPLPPASAARPLPAAVAPPGVKPLTMPPSTPTRVALPRLGIDADLLSLGLASDGSIDVPSEAEAREAAWYDLGPTPGELGPAVISGHVDSYQVPAGRAAFYFLGDARPGDKIEVLRADHSVAEFTVDSVQLFEKSDFPTDQVYGDVGYAGLRLITCGGGFTKAGGYTGNTVVFAHLTSARGVAPPPPITDNGPIPGILPADPTTPAHKKRPPHKPSASPTTRKSTSR